MHRKLEICCYSLESAIDAEKSGANRVELCDNYSEGGTTPSYASIQMAVEKLKIPVNVIIRPRGGDFLYSDLEYEVIKGDVLTAKELGANGIVIGFLSPEGEIDIEKIKDIKELANPMEVTFHRAFDMCNNPIKALKQLKSIGITRILTSGAKNTAIEGIDFISELVKKAGNDIIIMPGSGVNPRNLDELILKTKALEYHSSAKIFKSSNMNYFNKDISMGGIDNVDEFAMVAVDKKLIREMVDILK